MTTTHDQEKHLFIALDDDGCRMGEIEYSPRDEKTIAAIHTTVDEMYRGMGVADTLLSAMTAWAETNGMKIEPVCTFVADAFRRQPERFKNVVK